MSRGFSIVELMLALSLGSVLALGVMQLFAGSSATYALLQGQSRMQETARFALAIIGRSITAAGYRGCRSDPAGIDVVAQAVPHEFDLLVGVEGHDGMAGGGWNPPLARLPVTSGRTDTSWAPDDLMLNGEPYRGARRGINVNTVIHGTDVITVRHASIVDSPLVQGMAGSASPIVIAEAESLLFDRDHFALIHDCERASLFRVTDMDTWAGVTTIRHTGGDADCCANRSGQLGATFGMDAAVAAIESHTYYLAPGAGRTAAGARPVSLWRKSGVAAPVELAEGVSNMQFTYGVDSDGDRVPNRYVDASRVGEWRNVVTVRVMLVVGSVEDAGARSGELAGPCGAELNARGDTRFCHPSETHDGQLLRRFSQTFMLRNSP